MTQTECLECDFSENCDWGLIIQNMVPMSPICVAKQWHEKSMHTFYEQKVALRQRLTVGEFCENSKKDRDLL
jgi:hypothetical protein